MASDRWQQIQALFQQALEIPPGERDSFLRRACASDEALYREVSELLEHDTADSGQVEAAIGEVADDLFRTSSVDQVGKLFGAWELVEHLSDGGMGAVYLARRADGAFEQQAALKILNPALFGEQGIRRLAAERQILANLNHPNIASLLDGGSSDDGVPFIVMEYVDGKPVDAYCNDLALDTESRLQLFMKVCTAVDYAHRNLVVHRDIKPSNILVQPDGEPKLIDFGISKLLGSADPGITQDNQRLFTPAHASPEQITGSAITTATDVYALGILLYDLLTGCMPFAGEDDSTQSPALMAQRILETDPPSPSDAVTMRSSRRLTAGPQQGSRLTPERLRRELQDDLDNIVMMALRKEPERRYPSVRALQLDIQRYLEDRPVLARPDSLGYRAAKLFKRRRGTILAAAAVIVLVIAQSAYYFSRIVAERDAAEDARLRAENAVVFLEDLLRGADRFASAGREVTVRDILDRGAQRIEAELADQPLEQARLMHIIAKTYLALSLYEAAREPAEQSLALRRANLGEEHRDTLESMRTLGSVYLNSGDPVAALPLLEEALALQKRSLGATAPEVAETLHEIGVTQRVLGSPSAALDAQREAYDILSRLPPSHPHYPMLPRVSNQVGNALDAMARHDEAIPVFEESLALLEGMDRADDPIYGAALHNIGLSHRAMGRLDEGLPYLERALQHTGRTLGENTEDYEAQASTLGRTYAQLGRFEEGEHYAMLALTTAERLYGTQHQYYAYNLVNVARLRQLQDRHAEALELLNEATGVYRATFGPYHRFLAAAEVGQAESMVEVGRPEDAAEQLVGVIERLRADPEHERHVEAVARSVYGKALGDAGEPVRARELLEESLSDLNSSLGEDHPLSQDAAGRLERFEKASTAAPSPIAG